MGNIIHRGDIFYANLNDNVTGSEQTGIRPVIILQNNIGNYFSLYKMMLEINIVQQL